jgi:hypothetical protein
VPCRFAFVYRSTPLFYADHFVFKVSNIRTAFKRVYKLPDFTLGGRLKKGSVAVPVGVWIRSVQSVLPDLATDPLILAENRKKVSSSLR